MLKLPMQFRIFILFTVLVNGVSLTSNAGQEQESSVESNSIVICRHCGHDLFDPQDIFDFSSPGSLQTKNNTLIGSVRSNVQLLQNPHGYQFEVVTVRHSVCAPQGTWHSSHSWFPGYSWKICLCPTCNTHIGWVFKKVESSDENSTNNSFFGLILDRILEESKCETEFAYRFSDDDPEFVRQREKGTPEPPVMVPWFSRRPWQERGGWRGGRGGRGGGGRDFRDDRDRSGGRHMDRDRGYERDRSGGRDYRDDRDRGRDYNRDNRRGGGDYRDDRRGGGDYRDDRDRGRDQYRDGRAGGSGQYGGDRRPYY